MAKKNDSWGIEVGSGAIKAMRLVRSGSQVELADYEILPFKKILTTPDLNVEEAIRVNLDQLLSKHDLAHSSVVLSVPGNIAFARFAKLPPVEPKKIPDIVRFEAVQQIPFPIEQVEWDYQVFQQPDAPDVEVGIFAISKERIHKFLSNYRQLNIRVDAVTLSPIAVYNAFHYENKDSSTADGTIYMDIGTVSTDVIIVEGDGIWLRTLPIGGNNFTEALVRAFKLSFPKADKLKREASTSKYARQIFQAMRPVFADLVQELQRSLGYYQSMNRDSHLTKLVGVGSTFRLPGLQKYLKQQLQMEVTRPDGFKRLTVEGRKEADFTDNALNMATAYGLALQGLGLEMVSANLLPSHILKARMWRAKQPWVAGAAACLVVAAGLAGARFYAAQGAYTQSLNATRGQWQNILNTASNYQDQWNQLHKTKNPQVEIANLRQVVDYRRVVPDVMKDISVAVASINPQKVLLSNDYDAIAKIPRDQRRQIFLNSIRTIYVPVHKKGAAASSGFSLDMGGGYGGPPMMGPMDQGPGMVGPIGPVGPAGPSAMTDAKYFGKDFPISTFWQPKPQTDDTAGTSGTTGTGPGIIGGGGGANSGKKTKPVATVQRSLTEYGPRLIITLTGTTPYGDATTLLNEVIDSLEKATDGGNQPIKTVKVNLDHLEPIGNQNRTSQGGSSPYSNSPYGPGAGGGPGMAGGGGMSPQQPQIQDTDDVSQLMPNSPLAQEDRSQDQRFTITWIVQLEKPAVVRQLDATGPSPRSQQPVSPPQARNTAIPADQETHRS